MSYKKIKTIAVSKKDAEGKSIKNQNGGAYWINCGSMLKNEKGQIIIMLDAIPLSGLGHGALCLNVFEPKKEEEPI